MTPCADLYSTLRAVLGDRQVMGMWNYAESDLLSALRAVFALGRGPAGYALNGSINSATEITPAIEVGDVLALIVYEAAMILVGGEDGAVAIRTRALSVNDSGHRKRDLLWELRNLIHDIRSGGSYFSTRQSVAAWIGAHREGVSFLEYGTMTMRSAVYDVTL